MSGITKLLLVPLLVLLFVYVTSGTNERSSRVPRSQIIVASPHPPCPPHQRRDQRGRCRLTPTLRDRRDVATILEDENHQTLFPVKREDTKKTDFRARNEGLRESIAETRIKRDSFSVSRLNSAAVQLPPSMPCHHVSRLNSAAVQLPPSMPCHHGRMDSSGRCRDVMNLE